MQRLQVVGLPVQTGLKTLLLLFVDDSKFFECGLVLSLDLLDLSHVVQLCPLHVHECLAHSVLSSQLKHGFCLVLVIDHHLHPLLHLLPLDLPLE